MYPLRSASRACRDECDFFVVLDGGLQDHIYKSEREKIIDNTCDDPDVIRRKNSKLRRATRGLLKCILDESSRITEHVRNLQIWPLQQELFDSVIESAPERILTSLTNLKSLRYERAHS
jgi:hypothetical protein